MLSGFAGKAANFIKQGDEFACLLVSLDCLLDNPSQTLRLQDSRRASFFSKPSGKSSLIVMLSFRSSLVSLGRFPQNLGFAHRWNLTGGRCCQDENWFVLLH